MKTNSLGKFFTIEQILKIDFQNFHNSWKASKGISWTFIGSLHNETEMLWKKYFTVFPRLKRSFISAFFNLHDYTFKQTCSF